MVIFLILMPDLIGLSSILCSQILDTITSTVCCITDFNDPWNMGDKSGITYNSLCFILENNTHMQVVDYLLSRGVDVNISGSVGDRPLHLATGRGDYRIVQMLLKKGARGKWQS